MFRADRVEEMLRDMGKTPSDMLRELKMGRNQFHEWKNNGRTPSARAVKEIANYLHTSVAYLNGTTDIKNPMEDGFTVESLFAGIKGEEAVEPQHILPHSYSPTEKEIIDIYRKLDLRGQNKFLTFLLSL